MGGLLTLPLRLFSTLTEKGVSYCLSYIVSYIYLTVSEYYQSHRFDLYDYSAYEQPDRNSFFVPDVEWKLDCPQKDDSRLNENADDVFCFGVNSRSDALAVHIARLGNDHVYCSLFLRLADGRIFYLPEEYVVQREVNEDNTFGSSRFKLQCLLPMRKWRIFFNGLLQVYPGCSEDSVPNYQHVKLAFICTASSTVFDFKTDMSKLLLAQNAALSTGWKINPKCYFQRIHDIFNAFEQPGMMLGTVMIHGEPEREMYLWGTRGHYMGETRNLKHCSFLELYGNFQNGAVLHAGILNLDGLHSKFLYGYIMRSDGFIHPIEEMKEIKAISQGSELEFSVFCGGKSYNISIKESTDGVKFEKEFNGLSNIRHAKMCLNEMKGHGFILKGVTEKCLKDIKIAHPAKQCYSTTQNLLTVSFEDMECEDPALTGGKGSSLSKLYSFSKRKCDQSIKPMYEVPKGIVVTTEAYKLFICGELHLLSEFEKQVWSDAGSHTNDLCTQFVEKLQKIALPDKLVSTITNNLKKIFPDDVKRRFAVRSSAVGEDNEQMSAAGQMDTFLGLSGIDEVLEAVKMCWISQFKFQPVEYKRCYGQCLNTPMAVVIQEMVPCETAGVMFSCDPVTGNPSYFSITSNWGLGESVVSASAEPDTIILERDIKGKIQLHSQVVGKKQSMIMMHDHSGTKSEPCNEKSESCSLTADMALLLGEIAVQIENEYGSPRDIEWGIVGNKIFLFQARPITSLDIETDFEARHFFDSFLRAENECFTSGNVGEVMPGAMSILSLDLLWKIFDTCFPRVPSRKTMDAVPHVPYYTKSISYAYNHVFMNFIDAFLRFEQSDSDYAKAGMISVLGKIIDDKEVFLVAEERHDAYGKAYKMPLSFILYQFWVMLFHSISKKFLNKLEKFDIPIAPKSSAMKILNQIGCNLHVVSEAMKKHIGNTVLSSTWNVFLLSLLAKAKGGWDSAVCGDFAYLLSSCSKVESADVPKAIQNLGCAIAKSVDAEEFLKMKPEVALKWLQCSTSEAGRHFQQFLVKHGHRCIKEFDVLYETWGTNPLPLVKILQELVASGTAKVHEKNTSSSSSLDLSKLHVELNFISRLKLRWFVSKCREKVSAREASKSFVIKTMNVLRIAFYHLADVMVRDGYISNKKLIFFLACEEIKQLILTRSPRILARAIKRMKCHEELGNLIFPDMFKGIPKPIVSTDENDDATVEDLCMTGVAACQGIVKATARVIKNLDEAVHIQPGDILITCSTDIGWSPYFPLISGLVTELGGLISHGTVVAREYGLPCVIGVCGATRSFKSGDLVVLDGNAGTVTRMKCV